MRSLEVVTDRESKGAGDEKVSVWRDLQPTHSSPKQVVIFHTDPQLTRVALAFAGDFANYPLTKVTILEINEVPYALPLDRPNIDNDFLLKRLKRIAGESRLAVRVMVVVAREKVLALRRCIDPGALVLIAARRRAWRTAEEKMARTLARAGFRVLLLFEGAAHAPARN